MMQDHRAILPELYGLNDLTLKKQFDEALANDTPAVLFVGTRKPGTVVGGERWSSYSKYQRPSVKRWR
jgi:hypothetical protein